jgi:membrane-bound ClpP family serine protease
MSNTQENKKSGFVLEKDNFILLGLGFAIIVFGLMLMAGGKSDDPNVFNETMFSFTRITIAPLVVLAGLAFEIYAIMKKPKSE